ncbi:hypothetical protein [Flexithrix dorotheae]|uniref:hypothetical protein n=1 Tax=Flexithrix dorotheae TaxID=70993 RepID=UPI0005C7A102|nr:hypothetical protein [Flexithrix dorotheae]
MNNSTLSILKKRILNALAILTVCVCFAGFCEDSALPINISKTMEYEYTISLTDEFEGSETEVREVDPQEEQDFQDNKESIKEFTLNKLEYQITGITGQDNIEYANAEIHYTPSSNIEIRDGEPIAIEESKVVRIMTLDEIIKLTPGKHELVLPANIKSALTELLNTEQPFYVAFSAKAKTTGPASISVKVYLDVTAKTEQEL